MQHTVCSSVMVPSMRLTRRGGICQPTRQLKGSGHDRHDEAHPRHSSTGRVGNSGAWWGIVGAAPRSSHVLARTHSSRGGPGGGQGSCLEPHAVHRSGASAGRRSDKAEVAVSESAIFRHLRLEVASAERHPGHDFARPGRIVVDPAAPEADVGIMPLSWEGDVGADAKGDVVGLLPSSTRAVRDWASACRSTPLERTRSFGGELRHSAVCHRRVTFGVTLAPHHPPLRMRLDVGPTAPTGGNR
jgi:hypothetical protein